MSFLHRCLMTPLWLYPWKPCWGKEVNSSHNNYLELFLKIKSPCGIPIYEIEMGGRTTVTTGMRGRSIPIISRFLYILHRPGPSLSSCSPQWWGVSEDQKKYWPCSQDTSSLSRRANSWIIKTSGWSVKSSHKEKNASEGCDLVKRSWKLSLRKSAWTGVWKMNQCLIVQRGIRNC